jgi:deoxycytidine triphosphate deaminase
MEHQVTPKKILDVRFLGSFSVLYQGGARHVTVDKENEEEEEDKEEEEGKGQGDVSENDESLIV